MKNFLVVVLGVSLSALCMHSVTAWLSPEELEAFQVVNGTQGEAVVEPQVAATAEPEGEVPDIPQIQVRITCDLMSGWVWGERLCAAHCIVKGFRGGWCDNKRVCNCRR